MFFKNDNNIQRQKMASYLKAILDENSQLL
jgi:hypothetical protein